MNFYCFQWFLLIPDPYHLKRIRLPDLQHFESPTRIIFSTVLRVKSSLVKMLSAVYIILALLFENVMLFVLIIV